MKKPQAIINKMIENALAPFKRRVRTMVMRAVVELVTESKKTQTVQVSRAEDLLDDDVERFQDFGFSSVPLKDAEAIILMVGASSEHPVAIKVDDKRYRPKTLAEGESCVWIVKDGAGLIRLLCKANGEVHLGSSPANFVALANLVDAELTKIATTLGSLTGGVSSVASFGTSYSRESVAATEVKAK